MEKKKRPYKISKEKLLTNIHMGKDLKKLVRTHGFRTVELSTELNCSRQTLYNIYRTRLMTGENLIQFSQLLKIDLFEFFSNKIYGKKDQQIQLLEKKIQSQQEKMQLMQDKINLLEKIALLQQK